MKCAGQPCRLTDLAAASTKLSTKRMLQPLRLARFSRSLSVSEATSEAFSTPSKSAISLARIRPIPLIDTNPSSSALHPFLTLLCNSLTTSTSTLGCRWNTDCLVRNNRYFSLLRRIHKHNDSDGLYSRVGNISRRRYCGWRTSIRA